MGYGDRIDDEVGAKSFELRLDSKSSVEIILFGQLPIMLHKLGLRVTFICIPFVRLNKRVLNCCSLDSFVPVDHLIVKGFV